ncbi:MAG TPA: helix-turn-helix domain-containing protein [Acidimicrobiales bacterium]|nr:helix-turn-helix domain-containing protein [Acidimicrobiales bacterium]
MEKLLSTEELAELLGVPVATIYRWRHYGGPGPTAIRVGKHLRWRESDVDEWIDGLAEQEKAKASARTA